MPIETIKLADIVIDEALQPRVAVNWDVTRDYGKLMREGAQFPPIRVYRIDGVLKLSDGRHRVEARKFIRADDILARPVRRPGCPGRRGCGDEELQLSGTTTAEETDAAE